MFTILVAPQAIGQGAEYPDAIAIGPDFNVQPGEHDLQHAIDLVRGEATLAALPGRFEAVSTPFEDLQCGNCQDPATHAQASTGFVIKGKSLTIIGPRNGQAELITNAGYGIYIEDCPHVVIRGFTITGGIRDADGSATDAGIVVRRSFVEIDHCEICNNQGDFEKTICGIGGVMGREGAIIHIHDCKIHDNSWDGVALYRGAVADIHDNTIYNGRGAGIGITWDARATAIRNEIHDYWKGIGSFGDTRVGAYNNYVHDLAGWGIIAAGTSDMICRNNTVVRCGNVGIAGWESTAKMEIVNNIIAFNGPKDQWVAPRVGIWMNCDPGNFTIAYNDIFGNHDADVAFGYKESPDGSWSFEEKKDYSAQGGNISADPLLFGETFDLQTPSPCIDSGDPAVLDSTGHRSNIGATGGAFART
jgi:hypothetical protein